jgi:hypothetical protein
MHTLIQKIKTLTLILYSITHNHSENHRQIKNEKPLSLLSLDHPRHVQHK